MGIANAASITNALSEKKASTRKICKSTHLSLGLATADEMGVEVMGGLGARGEGLVLAALRSLASAKDSPLTLHSRHQQTNVERRGSGCYRAAVARVAELLSVSGQ